MQASWIVPAGSIYARKTAQDETPPPCAKRLAATDCQRRKASRLYLTYWPDELLSLGGIIADPLCAGGVIGAPFIGVIAVDALAGGGAAVIALAGGGPDDES